ncbi:pyridoxal phosphate-dependent aminotransferase [Neorhizobium sp. BETTINA12A]|uniref:pyridoxal phosphate-dependent aminotransferase n=1 Tax=Neorhizobium sp. BETTINA12A TaxID=2908924 RepID=UPI001FF4BC27|nr:pyridoxal phosphate-dependent aminotransferase [Neorhizobium sp. BETTINA12A]MCJ9750401.1 pyridoxal phosphate-dependent aminotransferase [Neorhizobium sp. BETTINA12A]
MNFFPVDLEGLFSDLPAKPGAWPSAYGVPRKASPQASTLPYFLPTVGERTIELFECVSDPDDALELRDLYLGRVECEALRGEASDRRAILWLERRRRRNWSAEEILNSRAAIRFVKELFNSFFRDDLYGRFRSNDTVILSSGSVCEESFGLPEAAKAALRFALKRDWYGYSDSRGRLSARDAIAAYETARISNVRYTAENIAITMGGTAAVSVLADLLLTGQKVPSAPALCPIPNYPPLIESIARRHHVQQVPLISQNGRVSLRPLLDALTPATPLVLLQTVANPTGAVVDENDIRELIAKASPTTMILLDECHEFLGSCGLRTCERAAANVVRISSMSKTWSAPGMKIGWIVADAAIISDFYEYASTSYGGPPSLFYTLIEVVTRMERWLLEGVDDPGSAELSEFDPGYGLTGEALAAAFRSYRAERNVRASSLLDNRAEILESLQSSGFDVLHPAQSINATLAAPWWDDPYVAFRNLLSEANVSLFPSVLTFGYDMNALRVTTSRKRSDLKMASERLAMFASDMRRS